MCKGLYRLILIFPPNCARQDLFCREASRFRELKFKVSQLFGKHWS